MSSKPSSLSLLVTGGCGFIGTNFIHFFLQKYPAYEIINYDILTYAGDKDNVVVPPLAKYTFVQGDICDEIKLAPLVEHCDVIVHFAAHSHVDRSLVDPRSFVTTNIVGTFTLLELARRYNKRFHHVSTDEVFGSLPLGGHFKFSESSSYDPHSPYSASKASSDHLVRSYFHTFGLPVTISTCSNNYGPYQYREKFIPLAITNLIEGKKIQIYGDGRNVRDWVHVTDHIRALDLVIHRGKMGETYCIGGDQELDNLSVSLKIARFFGADSSSFEFIRDRPGHDLRYAIDSSKIKENLGWKPEISFDDGLTETVSWYRDHEFWWKSHQTSPLVHLCESGPKRLGILLAGGTGSRLRPSTNVTNKHLLNVYNRPMIDFPLQTLRDLGLKRIVVVCGTEHVGSLVNYMCGGNFYEDIDLTFKVQNKADGIAGALRLCSDLIASVDQTVVVLGDNIFATLPFELKSVSDSRCSIVLARVKNPERFGVACVDERGKVRRVVEKPEIPPSNLAVTGLYVFDSRLTHFLPSLVVSKRGEYEVVDIINMYLDRDGCVEHFIVDGFWSDAGTPESLYESTCYVRDKLKLV